MEKDNFIIPTVDTLICDDIRQEVGNKISLIGIYQNIILIPTPEFIFPKLCFVTSLLRGQGTFDARVEFLKPNNEKIDTVYFKGICLPSKEAQFKLFSVFGNVKISSIGLYKLQLFFDGYNGPIYELLIEIKLIDK